MAKHGADYLSCVLLILVCSQISNGLIPGRVGGNAPPPYDEVARMARYIMHNSVWGSVATISVQEPIKGFPFTNLFSVSDGSSVVESSGIPYFYVTPLAMSIIDLQENNQTTIMMSLAQGNYCDDMHMDPASPLCARIILSGYFVEVVKGSSEEAFARKALFSRHPEMPSWPSDFFFAKIEITNVLVLDFFGGASTVPVQEYFLARPY